MALVRTAARRQARSVGDTALIDAAVKHFGLTRDIREAGYVLPDGRMLDLSGRHYSGEHIRVGDFWRPAPGMRDWLAGQRNVDHRELADLLPTVKDPFGSSTPTMYEFMRRTRALRVSASGSMIQTVTRPTEFQLGTAISNIRRAEPGEAVHFEFYNLAIDDSRSIGSEKLTVAQAMKVAEDGSEAFGQPFRRPKGRLGNTAALLSAVLKRARAYGLSRPSPISTARVPSSLRR